MPLASSVNARAVALQLGNLYLLLALIGLAVLQTTSEVRVVRNYIIALWIADIGHVAATYLALGEDTFNVGQWNAMAWGNVGMTVSCFRSYCADHIKYGCADPMVNRPSCAERGQLGFSVCLVTTRPSCTQLPRVSEAAQALPSTVRATGESPSIGFRNDMSEEYRKKRNIYRGEGTGVRTVPIATYLLLVVTKGTFILVTSLM